MSLMVVEQNNWQRVFVLAFDLLGKVLDVVVEGPFVRWLIKFDVVAVADYRTDAAEHSEAWAAVSSFWHGNRKVHVFRIPSSLLNAPSVHCGPTERLQNTIRIVTHSSAYIMGWPSSIMACSLIANYFRLSSKISGGLRAELSVLLVNLYLTPCA